MTGSAIANYDDLYARRMQTATQGEQLRQGMFISTRGGTMSLGEEAMPGNQVCVVIVDWVRENTLYAERYNPDSPQPPICYSFARGPAEEQEMGPHPSMQADLNYFQPQNDLCATCQHNQWGSADKGRGKACQNRRRLTMIPAGVFLPKRGSRDFDLEIFTDPKHFETADTAFMKLPVTSVENWGKYVHQVGEATNRSPDGVITRVFLEPHAKYQYVVNFELLEKVPDELVQAVIRRADIAQSAQIEGYMPPKKDDVAAPQQGGGSLRNLKRTFSGG
jgi:hypothetical protein